MSEWLYKHSLTVVFAIIGAGLIWWGWQFEHGSKEFDTLIELGGGSLVIATYNWLSGPLKEVNKPDL